MRLCARLSLPLPVRRRVLLMVGAGGLAPHLVAAHRAVRPSIERVLIWNRSRDRAAAVAATVGAEVADDLATAAEEADIVCTATMTKEALVEGSWLRPGTHLDLVGAYLPDHREVDDAAVVRAELYVDAPEVTTEEDGDLVIPLAAGLITLDDIRGDLFQLCRGEVEGRTDPAPSRSSRTAAAATSTSWRPTCSGSGPASGDRRATVPPRLLAAHAPAPDAAVAHHVRRPHREHGRRRATRRPPPRLLPRAGTRRGGDDRRRARPHPRHRRADPGQLPGR